MNKTKVNILKKKIISKLSQVDLPIFFVDDIKKSLKLLHYYKLKNLFKHLDDLIEYLLILDKQNTSQISNLCQQNKSLTDLVTKDNYYLSDKGLQELSVDQTQIEIIAKIGIDYQLNSCIMATKGILLLTLNEFCNATNTRICINKMIWQRQGNFKVKQK